MEIGTCLVRLNGDRNMEIVKKDVTPAEVAILRARHGNDAVLSVQAKHMDKRSHREEAARLIERYGKKVFEAAFPGALPQLPVYFKDVEVVPEIAVQEADRSEEHTSELQS